MKLFKNGDLNSDLGKHLMADNLHITKSQYHNGEENTWTIDVNDDGYFYYNVAERDFDFGLLQNKLIKKLKHEKDTPGN